jgi:hypothetical protein
MAVALLRIQLSNWTGEATFANELLGLEEEDLETARGEADFGTT